MSSLFNSSGSENKRSKRKRYIEPSDDDDDDDEATEVESSAEDLSDEESKPPAKRPARTSSSNSSRKRQKIQNDSPRAESGSRSRGGRRSAPSPEIEYESKVKCSRRAPSELSVSRVYILTP